MSCTIDCYSGHAHSGDLTWLALACRFWVTCLLERYFCFGEPHGVKGYCSVVIRLLSDLFNCLPYCLTLEVAILFNYIWWVLSPEWRSTLVLVRLSWQSMFLSQMQRLSFTMKMHQTHCRCVWSMVWTCWEKRCPYYILTHLIRKKLSWIGMIFSQEFSYLEFSFLIAWLMIYIVNFFCSFSLLFYITNPRFTCSTYLLSEKWVLKNWQKILYVTSWESCQKLFSSVWMSLVFGQH